MGEELKEWTMMWGAKVKLPNDMPDDMLKDSIETSRRLIENVTDFESQGMLPSIAPCAGFVCVIFLVSFCIFVSIGLQCAEQIKAEFDKRWSPHWHVIVGRNFGSFVTHETKNFVFFYLGDHGVLLFKAG
jgi:dynein light chain LC8-type